MLALKVLVPLRRPLTRCCSDFVSRMRWLNRLKEDDASCSAASLNSQVILFHRLSPVLRRTQEGTFRPVGLDHPDLLSVLERLGSDEDLLKESVLIGCSEQDRAQFCLDLGGLDRVSVEAECKGKVMDLRKAFFLLTGPEAPVVAKAQALLRWHQTTGFCSASGQPTHRNRAGSHRVCTSSGITYYPKMSPVVIVLVSDGSRCLLGRQASFPAGMYSALAGFCDMGETLEETLSREVAEEVGLELTGFSFSSSQHWPFPHSSFMLGCHASVSPAHSQVNMDHCELEDARWFSLEEVTAALQVAPPTRGSPAQLWLPPKHAIANRLITEWVELQRQGGEGDR